MAEPIRRPHERIEMKAIREVNKPKKLTPRERLLEAIKRARFDARLKMIRLKNNKSRYLRNAAVVATAAGVLGVGAGLAHFASKPNSQPQKPRVERVERANYASKEQTRSTIYESKEQKKSEPKISAERLERQRRYAEEEKARLDEINKRKDFVGSFLENPVQGVKQIRSIKNKELRDQYADWALSGAANIEHFERVYTSCKDKEFQKELIKKFGDSFVGSGDGGFQHAYDLELLSQIKNVNLRQSVFERILYGHAEGDTATVLSTLHHQYEYDALVQLAKTLPNAKKYILELQKQKKLLVEIGKINIFSYFSFSIL